MSKFSKNSELAISIRDQEIAVLQKENEELCSKLNSLKHEKFSNSQISEKFSNKWKIAKLQNSQISERLQSLGKIFKRLTVWQLWDILYLTANASFVFQCLKSSMKRQAV